MSLFLLLILLALVFFLSFPSFALVLLMAYALREGSAAMPTKEPATLPTTAPAAMHQPVDQGPGPLQESGTNQSEA